MFYRRIDRVIPTMIFLVFAFMQSPDSSLLAREAAGQWRFLGLTGKTIETLRMHKSKLYAATTEGLYRKDAAAQDTTWTPIGLQGKNTRTLLIFDADTILASTRYDTVSLYRTTDGGATWQSYQNGFGGEFAETVLALEPHPENPNILFGAGAAVVAKSPDRGRSWQISNGYWQGLTTGFSFIHADTANPDIVWAGGQNSIERAVLWKTENGGQNWQEWPEVVEDVSVSKSVAIHPQNSDIVYLGMESYILKTTNGGQTWEEILHEDARFYFGLAMNPQQPTRMYTASWFKTSEPQPLNMYISDDAGETWETITHPDAEYGGVWEMLHIYNGSADKFYLGLDKGGVYEFIADIPTSTDPEPKPVTFQLGQNYPNPFNPETVIPFTLSQSSHVNLKVYNLLGQEVANLVDGIQQAGDHKITWHAAAMPSGVYIYRLKTMGQTATKRLLLLR